MELRDRTISAKTRYSAKGPGLWTRLAAENAPTPEPQNRMETNSLSPEGKSKRKREVDHMRSKRTRTAASEMGTTNRASSSQAQEAHVGMNRSRDRAQRGQALQSRNEEILNGPESSHGEYSSDEASGSRRYSFSTHRNEPTFLDRISVLPEMRDLPWREGQELPPEKSTDSPRVQQRGACMVATRGRVMTKPCTHCDSGFGRFSQCIVLEEWFQGACATCIFTSKGNKCSLRIKHLGNQDARALRYTNDPAKRKRVDISPEKKAGEDDNSIFNRFNSPGHYVSPYPPLPSIPRPPLRTPGLREAQEAELDSLLQAQIAREEADQGNLDERESVGNRQQVRAAPIVMHRPRLYPPLPDRQIAQPIHTLPNGQITRNPVAAVSPHTMEGSLIATSSKSTQRQLFTVMSGVQGGLQQLQKELNSLKAVLGWDVEDEEPGVNRQQQPSREDARPGP